MPVKDLAGLSRGEPSAIIRARVVAAREIQKWRYQSMTGVHSNADAKSRDLQDICRLSTRAQEEVRHILETLQLSARAYDRILRVARTIADLAEHKEVSQDDIMEAASYRQLDDGSFWA